jgi:hypothetical protein
MLKLAKKSDRSISLSFAAALLSILVACTPLAESQRGSSTPTVASPQPFWGYSAEAVTRPSGPAFWGYSEEVAAQPSGPTFWGYSAEAVAQASGPMFWGYSASPVASAAPAVAPARPPIAAKR